MRAYMPPKVITDFDSLSCSQTLQVRVARQDPIIPPPDQEFAVLESEQYTLKLLIYVAPV